jgi:hypothetical protein
MKNHARKFRCQSAAKSNLGLKIRLPGSPKNTLNLLTKNVFSRCTEMRARQTKKFPCSQGRSRQVGPRPPALCMGPIQQSERGLSGAGEISSPCARIAKGA